MWSVLLPVTIATCGMLENLCKNLIVDLTRFELVFASFCISSDHFKEGAWKNVSHRLKILKKIKGNGQTEIRGMDASKLFQ